MACQAVRPVERGGLALAGTDAVEAGAVDFTVIGRVVEKEGDADRREGRQPQAGEREPGVDEDEQHERRCGPEDVDYERDDETNGARARPAGQRYDEPAGEAERHHRGADQQGHAEAPNNQRRGLHHDVDVEELGEHRIHQARLQAKRISM
jgi:hypothetical protein